MKVGQSKLTAEGQTSVPPEVRKRLKLATGSVLEWNAEGDQVNVRSAGNSIFEDIHRVLFEKKPRPRDLTQLKEGIREHMRARHARA